MVFTRAISKKHSLFGLPTPVSSRKRPNKSMAKRRLDLDPEFLVSFKENLDPMACFDKRGSQGAEDIWGEDIPSITGQLDITLGEGWRFKMTDKGDFYLKHYMPEHEFVSDKGITLSLNNLSEFWCLIDPIKALVQKGCDGELCQNTKFDLRDDTFLEITTKYEFSIRRYYRPSHNKALYLPSSQGGRLNFNVAMTFLDAVQLAEQEFIQTLF